MFTVTDNTTLANGNTDGSPYANELADLQLPFVGIATEYVDITPDDLSITTDTPSFIMSGTGNDVIVDASAAPGDVVIDAGSGTNTIQCSSIPTSHDIRTQLWEHDHDPSGVDLRWLRLYQSRSVRRSGATNFENAH